MKLKVTTTTGSVYEIDTDTGWWLKNGEELHSELSALRVGEWDGTRTNIPDYSSWPEVDKPEVGKNMYIRGRDQWDWWLTTPVVSVEEVDSWE